GGVRAFFNERARIAVKLDAQGFGDRFAFREEVVEKHAGGREACSGAMVQQRERADGIRRSVENKLGPLCAACVFQRDDAHATAIQQRRELFDKIVGSVRWFERPHPSVPADVKADMARFDEMAGGKGGATNYVLHVLCKDFFIANAVLNRTNSTGGTKDVLRLLDRRTRVRAFGGNDAEAATRDLRSIRGCMEMRGEVSGAADAQAAFVDRTHVLLVYVIGVNFDVFQARQVRREQTSNRPAADDADLHAHAALRASAPEEIFHGTLARHSPSFL